MESNQKQEKQGLYPFSETNFQDFSRTKIYFSTTLKFTLTLAFYSQDRNVNSCYCLHISYLSSTDFQNFPGPVAFFQDFQFGFSVFALKLRVFCFYVFSTLVVGFQFLPTIMVVFQIFQSNTF